MTSLNIFTEEKPTSDVSFKISSFILSQITLSNIT